MSCRILSQTLELHICHGAPRVWVEGVQLLQVPTSSRSLSQTLELHVCHEAERVCVWGGGGYTCYKSPRHLGVYLRHWNYTINVRGTGGGGTPVTIPHVIYTRSLSQTLELHVCQGYRGGGGVYLLQVPTSFRSLSQTLELHVCQGVQGRGGGGVYLLQVPTSSRSLSETLELHVCQGAQGGGGGCTCYKSPRHLGTYLRH